MIKTAISFLLGAFTLIQFNDLPDPIWFCLLLPACILIIKPQTRLISFYLLGFLWAFYHAGNIMHDRLAPELDAQEVLISGIIASIPEKDAHRIRFIFEPSRQFTHDLPAKIRASWYQPYPDDIHTGELWQLKIKLKAIHGSYNPGGFDYEGWNFRQHIGASGYVRKSEHNKKLSTAPRISINTLREKIKIYLEQTLSSSPYLGIIEALTIGVRSHITPRQWQILRQTGTSHLVAISGLHIGLAATMGFVLFRFLWSRRSANLLLLPAHEFAAFGGVLFAVFYAAMAGFSIPTQRAMIMVTVVMITLFSRHPVNVTTSLALALLFILLWDPVAILSAGFWLSFTAVAIILLISQHRYPIQKWRWFHLHTLITIGLTPLLLLFFQQGSLVAPVANLLAIPFISFLIVPALLIAIVSSWISFPVATALFHISAYLLALFWPLLDFLAELDFSYWTLLPLPLYYWIPVMLAALLLLLPRGFPGRYLAFLGMFPLFFYSPPRPDKASVWFTLLDVGQGLSAVIQTHSHTVVFDTGPRFSPDFNTGTAIVRPFLTYHGITHVDVLIISHGDNDHIGGAIPLMHSFPVKQVISSVPERIPDAVPCLKDQSWHWDGVTFHVLNPDRTDTDSENNLSCVLKVTIGSHSLLLTGDIEKKAEQRLIERYGTQLKSTVLIAPHHGSNTSSSPAFIKAVNPDWVWFPVGYHNRYHFPHRKVLSRYKKNNIATMSTADSGAITIRISANSVSKPVAWRQKYKRIWSASQ